MSIPTMTIDLFCGQIGHGFVRGNLFKRLAFINELVKCNRCKGTGRYSWNERDGDKCYGCDGRGYLLPPLTMKRAKRIRELWPVVKPNYDNIIKSNEISNKSSTNIQGVIRC